MTTDDLVGQLMDRIAIVETVYRYASGLDRRDWSLYRSIFTGMIDVDFTAYLGGGKPVSITVDEWIASIMNLFEGLDATQHVMSNPQVSIAGNRATCVMYMQAEHLLNGDCGQRWYTIGGYYTDTLDRTANGWKISKVVLTVLWQRGDRGIMAEATARRAATAGDQ
jgi:hypothetical protein